MNKNKKENALEMIMKDIKDAINNKAYLAALSLALSVPAICGRIESNEKDNRRNEYVTWYDKWVKVLYDDEFYNKNKKTQINLNCNENDDFLLFDGDMCYNLRCAFLHEGNIDVNNVKGSTHIDTFELHVGNGNLHSYYYNHNGIRINEIDLDVILFCADIVNGAKSFLNDNRDIIDNSTMNIKIKF